MAIPRVVLIRVLVPSGIGLVLAAGIPFVQAAGRPSARSSPADRLGLGPGVANHPVGVVPSPAVEIPEGWPLGKDGSITCLTCHYELPPVSGWMGYSLRDVDEYAASAVEFCAKCHTGTDPGNAASMHWVAVQEAHVMPDDSRRGRSGEFLDEHSMRCLACHDGANASEAGYATRRNRGGGFFGDRRRNHPIGVRYPSHSPRRSSASFRPGRLLPREVRLPGGMVSCVSCHSLYATDRYHLAVPIEGSRLCFTCHQME